MNRIPIILFLSVFVTFQVRVAHSFDVITHRALSDRAVLSSNLDNFLKTELNFPGGVGDTLFNMVSRSIVGWLQEGSVREDNGGRFCNHFHNPLRTWDQAGLQIVFPFISGFTNHSSVLWGQRPDLQPMGEQFTWENARQRYFDGLTASTQTVREQNLALAFETLGHPIHLVTA